MKKDEFYNIVIDLASKYHTKAEATAFAQKITTKSGLLDCIYPTFSGEGSEPSFDISKVYKKIQEGRINVYYNIIFEDEDGFPVGCIHVTDDFYEIFKDLSITNEDLFKASLNNLENDPVLTVGWDYDFRGVVTVGVDARKDESNIFKGLKSEGTFILSRDHLEKLIDRLYNEKIEILTPKQDIVVKRAGGGTISFIKAVKKGLYIIPWSKEESEVVPADVDSEKLLEFVKGLQASELYDMDDSLLADSFLAYSDGELFIYE